MQSHRVADATKARYEDETAGYPLGAFSHYTRFDAGALVRRAECGMKLAFSRRWDREIRQKRICTPLRLLTDHFPLHLFICILHSLFACFWQFFIAATRAISSLSLTAPHDYRFAGSKRTFINRISVNLKNAHVNEPVRVVRRSVRRLDIRV